MTCSSISAAVKLRRNPFIVDAQNEHPILHPGEEGYVEPEPSPEEPDEREHPLDPGTFLFNEPTAAMDVCRAYIPGCFTEELDETELGYYRRGKNSHTHAAPKAASRLEYAMATGVETLFGALYLYGKTQRLNQLFTEVMEELYGL